MPKTNWKKLNEKIQSEAHAFPKGWSTKEEVAEELECAPERVNTILAPGIRSGEVERQEFTVWDSELRRLTRVTGYRERLDQSGEEVHNVPKDGTRVKNVRSGGLGRVMSDGRVKWDSGAITDPFRKGRNYDVKIVGNK